jgi:2-methylisocitrate lyase-like PEP mutase family enzyme
MRTQAEKGLVFWGLHQRPHAFIIPNPWDVGSARLLARLGFEALATTSAGFAFSMGKHDGTVRREEMLPHLAALAGATDLPVSGDLESGFGEDPRTVAETIRLAAAAGVVGGSIEDIAARQIAKIYDLELAAERVRAASDAARGLPFRFTLTARAENFIVGRPDLKDTIRRLQAFQEAGADVLYAPGLARREDIAEVVRSVDRPVNVLMGFEGVRLTVRELSAIGVRRVSVGSALARVSFGAFLRAAREMGERGSFEFAAEAVPMQEISAMFET